jgi:hypothetical protein
MGMFAITADQVGSRASADLVDQELAALDALGGPTLILPADRTAGDEIQVATENPATALSIVLHLTRTEQWSVGLGIGDVRLPLPEATRAVTGSAFILARDAVAAAKKRPTRFALAVDAGRLPDGEMLEPLIDLVLQLRDRRTAQGWQLHDLLRTGITQAEAAGRLGITPQAVSLRAQSAQLRTEFAAENALVRLLDATGAAPEAGS